MFSMAHKRILSLSFKFIKKNQSFCIPNQTKVTWVSQPNSPSSNLSVMLVANGSFLIHGGNSQYCISNVLC